MWHRRCFSSFMERNDIALKKTIGIAGLLLFALLAWIDYRTDQRLDLSLPYCLPIALWAWYLGFLPAACLALGGSLVLGARELFSHETGSAHYYELLDGTIRAAFLLAAAGGVSLLRRRFREESALRRHLAEALRTIQESAGDVLRLKGENLHLCPVTRQVKVGDQWIDVRSFLRQHLDLSVTEAVSDDAVSEIARRVIAYHELHDVATS